MTGGDGFPIGAGMTEEGEGRGHGRVSVGIIGWGVGGKLTLQ